MSARNKDSAESAASGLASADRSGSETAGAASFSSIPGFSQLSTQALLRFEAKAVRMRVRRGAVLVRQGDAADEVYLVLTGRFFVMLDGKPGIIAEIGPGEPIGELAFLGGGLRTASVAAARDSDVLMLTREAYAEIAREAPEIVSTILASVAKRLSAVTSASPVLKRRAPRTVAFLPIGEAGRLPDGFLERVRRAVAPLTTAIASRRTLSHGSAPDHDSVLAALAAMEREADLVLISVDRSDEELASLLLDHADELLLVAPAGDAETCADIPAAFERMATRLFFKEHVGLALLRDRAATPIAGTGRWLREREVALVHHVALDRPADLERLGRFLTGAAVGLVLGGGAALGCAHLGIARALGEAGIPLDFMGGTSVGAAVAASLAMGAQPDDILELSTQIFVRKRALRWLTIPVYSIIDHRRFDAELRRHYASTLIEDLPLNYFSVSANLTRNDIYVHREGLLWEAVRASSSVPGVLPPFITEGGDVLVDGALVDNVPVSVMRNLKLGPNVVVMLRQARHWRVSASYAEFPSRAALLRDLVLGRRRKHHPKLVTTLLRGLFLSGERTLRGVDAAGDVFVVPPGTEGVGMFDWHRGRDIAGSAYEYMAGLLASDEDVRGVLHNRERSQRASLSAARLSS